MYPNMENFEKLFLAPLINNFGLLVKIISYILNSTLFRNEYKSTYIIIGQQELVVNTIN